MTKHTTTAQIINALENADGDITAAAQSLGLRREAIYYRMNKNPDLFRIIERLRAERDAREKAEQEQNTNQPTAPETHEDKPATGKPCIYRQYDDLLDAQVCGIIEDNCTAENVPEYCPAVIAKNATTEAPSENTPADRETIDTAINRTKAAEEYRRQVIELERTERDISTAKAEALPTDTPTDASTAKPTAEKLPSIADQINRQAARDLAATIRHYIQYDGLPSQYAQVFDYLKYLDGKAAGRT